MKKILLMCCLVIGIATASYAQRGGGMMRMSPEDRTKMMTDSLKLSGTQSSQLLAIYKNAAVQRDSVMKAGGDRSAMRPMMMATNQKVMAILTDDQKATYLKMMQNMRAKMGGGGGGGGGN